MVKSSLDCMLALLNVNESRLPTMSRPTANSPSLLPRRITRC